MFFKAALQSEAFRFALKRVLPTAFLIMLGVGVSAVWVIKNHLETTVQDNVDRQVEQQARLLAFRLDTIVDASWVLAANEILIGGLVDEMSRTTLLIPFFKSLRLPGEGRPLVTLTDYRGRPVATNQGDARMQNYQDTPWLENVLSGFAELHTSANGLLMAVPVLYNSQPEGMLVAHYPIAEMRKALSLPIATTNMMAIVDEENKILTTTDHQFAQPGDPDPGLGKAGWIQSRAVVPGYPSLTLIVGQRESIAMAGVANMRNAIIVFSAISLVTIVLAIAISTGLVTSPLARLTRTVSAIDEANDLSMRIEPNGPEEFQQLAHAFNAMTARLSHSMTRHREAEAESKAKSDFLSRMSHELRTPMNAIMGFAQHLQTDPDYPLADDQKDSLDEILHAGEHLLELINEVLDLSRIESGKLEIKYASVDIVPIVEKSITLTQPSAQARNITINFTHDDVPPVWVDSLRAQQIIINLLSNAVKYNKDQGRVDIDISNANNNRVCIEITDSGHGISENDMKDLFEPFHRAGGNKFSAVEGTGIGLSITKQLVELMHGEVIAESTPDVGSAFSVFLPTGATQPPSANNADNANA